MILALALSLSLKGQFAPKLPLLPMEFRGVWVATVDNIDWPSKKNLSTDQQKTEMLAILDKAKNLHFNAIVLQVRPSADALYPSALEPWSEYLTGKQGRPPYPLYDPLQFAVIEAHKRGLELHAWFNPYRAMHPAQKGPYAENHISKTNPGLVKKYGPYGWMDPGETQVQQRSLDVILDVVKRYDIDGVHIDDYFYPYKEKDPKTGQLQDFPDQPSWQRYKDGGGKLDRGDWRRQNVDHFIERLYKAIKREKRWVKFGISPFGIYRPGVPDTIKANVDQYADLYADALKWLQNGWCDYMAPQLYWAVKPGPQSFPVLLNWWTSVNTAHRHMWPGLYTSRLFETTPKWPASEIVSQIKLARSTPGAGGTVQFSMKAMTDNDGGINEALLNGPFALPAFVPASPWLSRSEVRPPDIRLNRDGSAEWQSSEKMFAVTAFVDDRWLPWSPCVQTNWQVPSGATWVAVEALDRAGRPSEPDLLRVSLR